MEGDREESTAGRRGEELTLSFTVQTDGSNDRDQLADAVADALRPLAERAVNMSDLTIRTVARTPGGAGSAGYESRLWEKATCKDAGDPRDVVRPPEVDVEQVLQETRDLREQLQQLQLSVNQLSQRLGDG